MIVLCYEIYLNNNLSNTINALIEIRKSSIEIKKISSRRFLDNVYNNLLIKKKEC